MEIMQILYFSWRNVGSNAIFTIFASGGLPARLQSQRQLQSMLLTQGLPAIPAGRRSVSERQRDFEKCVFLECGGVYFRTWTSRSTKQTLSETPTFPKKRSSKRERERCEFRTFSKFVPWQLPGAKFAYFSYFSFLVTTLAKYA